MKKFAFITKQDEKSKKVEYNIKEYLDGKNWIYDEKEPEIIISIGGDGTLLYGVHQYLHQLDKVCFIGIHTGTLGFFTDYTVEELELFLHDITTREPNISESALLKMNIEGEETLELYALNEMRIENVIRTQILDIYIDDEFFETCRGTGICLSTQAGSTAYNRSLRGAVIDNGLSLMQLAEITGIQHNKFRSLSVPYIMKDDRTIVFKSPAFDEAILCYDHLHIDLKGTKKVICTMSEKKVRFARYREYSYLKRIKNLY